jgi:hypothetical protein
MMKLIGNRAFYQKVHNQVLNFTDKYGIERGANMLFMYRRVFDVEMENFWGEFADGKKAQMGTSEKEPVEKILEEVFNAKHNFLNKPAAVKFDHPDKVVKDYVGKIFKTAYEFMDRFDEGKMSTTDKIVEAQRISDVLINTYSPVLSDEKYAEYKYNYFVKNASLEELQDIVGSERDIDTVMENACNELGVEKTRVYLPDLSEMVGAADKADMIDEKSISAPSVEL